ALSAEIIVMPNPRMFAIHDAKFWEPYKTTPAWEYQRFLDLAEKGVPPAGAADPSVRKCRRSVWPRSAKISKSLSNTRRNCSHYETLLSRRPRRQFPAPPGAARRARRERSGTSRARRPRHPRCPAASGRPRFHHQHRRRIPPQHVHERFHGFRGWLRARRRSARLFLEEGFLDRDRAQPYPGRRHSQTETAAAPDSAR